MIYGNQILDWGFEPCSGPLEAGRSWGLLQDRRTFCYLLIKHAGMSVYVYSEVMVCVCAADFGEGDLDTHSRLEIS